ncbi:MAG TPA: pilin, partial [Rhodanobacteraceae bacterium]|nr:pilin [Rhodanobacteraceae bacterium]
GMDAAARKLVAMGARAVIVKGGHMEFQPDGSRGGMHWRCGSPDIQAKYLPLACRDRSDVDSAD